MIDSNKASGAYDKGTSTGKGRFELSMTYNPMGIVSYGQNYSVLSYGLSNSFDIVGYYSYHKNGTISQYLGVLYQFYNSENLDLATAIGIRNKNKGEIDFFAPQFLYNYHLSDSYSIGGSIVQVLENETFDNKGAALDITIYKRMNFIINNRIKDAHFGFGVFKNSTANLKIDNLYLHYSVDFIF